MDEKPSTLDYAKQQPQQPEKWWKYRYSAKELAIVLFVLAILIFLLKYYVGPLH